MSNELVVNELLAFLQQKLDVMDEVSAVQICSSNFSQDEIAAAKHLLFGVLNKMDQMVSRRRDGTRRSVQDIITLLKETDPEDVPTFVAKDLQKLPPVTFDHVDVTCLLKDIVSLKASLAEVQAKLARTEGVVVDLRKEVVELRKVTTLSRSPTSANINTRSGADLNVSFASAFMSSPSSPSGNADSAHSAAAAGSAACRPAPALAEPRVAAPRASLPAPLQVPAAAAKPHVEVRRSFASVSMSTSSAPSKPMPEKASNQATDGFVTVQSRKRRQRTKANRCGTAPASVVQCTSALRAAIPSTPVYVSRLHFTTKAEHIVEYVRKKTNFVPRVQLLESNRNVSFLSFVVRVPNGCLGLVMEESFWPKGVVILTTPKETT